MKSRPTVKQFLILSKNGVKRALSPLGQSLFNAYSENRDGKASSRRNILAENIFFNVIAAVTGGVFLTGLILIILENESETVKNQYLGLIISLQLLANTSQIFTPFLINKMKSYRAFSAACPRYVFHYKRCNAGNCASASLFRNAKRNHFPRARRDYAGSGCDSEPGYGHMAYRQHSGFQAGRLVLYSADIHSDLQYSILRNRQFCNRPFSAQGY